MARGGSLHGAMGSPGSLQLGADLRPCPGRSPGTALPSLPAPLRARPRNAGAKIAALPHASPAGRSGSHAASTAIGPRLLPGTPIPVIFSILRVLGTEWSNTLA